jgi:hypothetical protein
MTNIDDKPFDYLIARQKNVRVITLVGAIDANAVQKLDALKAEIGIEIDVDAQFFIFNFRDVSAVTRHAFTLLSKIQQIIRLEKNGKVFLSSMAPKIKEQLLKEGIIRDLEVVNNLRDALAFTVKKH